MKTGERRFWTWTLSVVALLHVVGGCDRVSNINGEQVFEYELWVPLTVLLTGLVAIPTGWALRKGAARLGWSMVIFGPLAAGLVAPSMFRERVVVGADRFQVRTGIFSSDVRSFKFADIDEIRLVKEITLGRRGRKRTSYYLNCHDKTTGGSSKVSINNAVTQAAAGAILREAVAHGVRIRGASDSSRSSRGPDW